ncbi:homoserine O-succinyltransferase [Collinsella sp. AGMB00827]|uniref:Homoserine O-acetyltransferase n=1 Tax=Collinsella ureilytica TaxID=2869515 RepID=A0ABS7MJN3_9ACTN|nr:homoserine O-succinyltransferase [Collinsella urealyticum]MBY4797569.1 homoserine O-succinyltransferase [Collinsella urealyticum]
MPIRIPDALPASSELESENIFVMTEFRALHQDIRPLRVLILNLMPTKIATETQIMRQLSNTPLQVEVELLRADSHESRNVSATHLETFYRTFRDVRYDRYDGLIITGAPVEQLRFEEVDYWSELQEIMDWSSTNVHSTLHICWGAQAGLYHHYGIPKYALPEKATGVFEHHLVEPRSPLVRGIDDTFRAVHSRNTEVRRQDIERVPELEIIAESDEAGLYIVKSTDSSRFFVFGHPEYDAETLRLEYERDLARGIPVAIPRHYFPGDDPSAEPPNTWRSHAQLLYTNWLNYYVYQTTPYDLRSIGRDVRSRSGLV